MPAYRFSEVPHYAEKSVKCDGGCGKKLRRQRKFTQTISPFNKDDRGNVKTLDQIEVELREKAKQWESEPETCRNCAATAAEVRKAGE